MTAGSLKDKGAGCFPSAAVFGGSFKVLFLIGIGFRVKGVEVTLTS